MQRMKKEVSPVLGVALILIALTAVLALYWRGLLRDERRGGGRSPGGGAAPPVSVALPGVNVETIVGQSEAGHRDGAATEALLDGPAAVAWAGDRLYIADSRNHTIRVLRDGQLNTLAGRAGEPGHTDGASEAARFAAPAGIAVGRSGVFVADTGNHRIRRMGADGSVFPYAGAVTPKDELGREVGGYRDGPASQALFRYPVGLAVDGDGTVYVADAGNHAVRRISPGGAVSTIAVEGELESPTAVCLTPDGSIWVSDTAGKSLWTGSTAGSLRRWQPRGEEGEAFPPAGLAWAADGTARGEWRLYVADSGGNRLFRVEDDRLLLVAGQSGPEATGWADGGGDSAGFLSPAGICAGRAGDLYVADYGNNRIRRVDLSGVAARRGRHVPGGGGTRSRPGGRRGGMPGAG